MAGASDHAWGNLTPAERYALTPSERNALFRTTGPGAIKNRPHITARPVSPIIETRDDRRRRAGNGP